MAEMLTERLQEYLKDARTLVDRADEALRHQRDGDSQSACNVVSISHYKLGQLQKEWDGLMKAFADRGVSPD